MAKLTATAVSTLNGSTMTVNTNDVTLVSKNEIGTAWSTALGLAYGTPDVRVYGQQLMQKMLILIAILGLYLGNFVTGHAVAENRGPIFGGIYLPRFA